MARADLCGNVHCECCWGCGDIRDLEAERDELRADLKTARRSAAILPSLDCRHTGAGSADLTGSHCAPDNRCQRCELEIRAESAEATLERVRSLLRQLEDERAGSSHWMDHVHSRLERDLRAALGRDDEHD